MPAYLIASLEVTDPAQYGDYSRRVAATVHAHGGRFIVAGGASRLLEGQTLAPRTVVLEFPDIAHLQAWYDSPEYRPLIELRQRASRGTLIAVEGVAP